MTVVSGGIKATPNATHTVTKHDLLDCRGTVEHEMHCEPGNEGLLTSNRSECNHAKSSRLNTGVPRSPPGQEATRFCPATPKYSAPQEVSYRSIMSAPNIMNKEGSRKILFDVSEQYDIHGVVGEGSYGVVW